MTPIFHFLTNDTVTAEIGRRERRGRERCVRDGAGEGHGETEEESCYGGGEERTRKEMRGKTQGTTTVLLRMKCGRRKT